MKKQIRQSFIKPMLLGFKDGIKIPPFFFNYCLHGRNGEARLRRGGREWIVKIAVDGFIADGWSRFATENGLAVVDIVKLERVETMAFVALVFDGASGCGKKEMNKEYPYFTSSLKAFYITHRYLHVPVHFAQTNGLCDKRKMILTDMGGRRCGAVRLSKIADRPDKFRYRINYSGCCSNVFIDASIRVGDAFKFELLENGAVPVGRITPFRRDA